MAENLNLNKLAASLSLEERHNLLDKLVGQSLISEEPLYFDEKTDDVYRSPDERYMALPWYYRLWYFILGLIRGKPPVRVYEDNIVAVLGNSIEDIAPGFLDYQRGKLLSSFYESLEKLKESARFFYDALDSGFNRDKGAFYVFLGSLEMAEIHKKLHNCTDPRLLEKTYPKVTEAELRKMAISLMEDALGEISDDQKADMYLNARSLFCLKELSSFLFDRVMMAFTNDSFSGGYSCSVNVVREPLLSLNNILFSLKTVPAMPLLESLFIFVLQERSFAPGFDINKEIQALLAKAAAALSVIREFNKQTPLTKILRCGTRDLSVYPKEISGAEDWFMVYREYWRRQTDGLFADYIRGRREEEIISTFTSFFGDKPLRMFGNTETEANPDGIPIKGSFALSFLLTFYPSVFIADLNYVLKPILIDGEFYRRENRIEFTENYNELIKLEDDIRRLEKDLAPDGDYGKRYAQAKQDMTSLPVKRRKIQIVLEEASGEALAIVEAARRASRSMVNILSGVVNNEMRGGRFDTLSNFAKLAGKGNEFHNDLESAIVKFKTVIQILEDIDAMEMGR